MPLVIVLHGSRSNGQAMANYSGFSAVADREGFVVAYPDAVVNPGNWNALFGKVEGGQGVAVDIDDVGFIRALIAHVETTFHTDPHRVFACGMSAGAYMAYRLAVELPDRLAAVGVVNGSLGIASVDGKPVLEEIPKPAGPISLMHICGRQDGIVKFVGGQAAKNKFKSVPDCVQFFVQSNGCDKHPRETIDAEHRVTRTLYTGGRDGAEVELIIVEKCGHEWPQQQRHGIAASRAMWTFFAAHPRRTAGRQ